MRKKKYILYFAAAAAAAGLGLGACSPTEGDGVICVSRTADSGERGLRVRNRV